MALQALRQKLRLRRVSGHHLGIPEDLTGGGAGLVGCCSTPSQDSLYLRVSGHEEQAPRVPEHLACGCRGCGGSSLAVMSFPAEGVESAIKNNIEDVRLFLDAKHPGRYAVYNLSLRTYRASKFHNRVSTSSGFAQPRVALVLP